MEAKNFGKPHRNRCVQIPIRCIVSVFCHKAFSNRIVEPGKVQRLVVARPNHHAAPKNGYIPFVPLQKSAMTPNSIPSNRRFTNQ